jgi:hypothetical protein
LWVTNVYKNQRILNISVVEFSYENGKDIQQKPGKFAKIL